MSEHTSSKFTDIYAAEQDSKDVLRDLRNDFVIPTRGDLASTSLRTAESSRDTDSHPSIYLCGNSLGLQPKLVAQYTAAYHQTWATKGVYGHFKPVDDSPLPPWLHVDDDIIPAMSAIVGAQHDEVAVMQTLTANLHLALASFYRPTATRHKILLEQKAFPSDHYAIESQIQHHGLSPATSMVTISPPSTASPLLTTSHILETITAHASSTAVLLLPAIQFYTGQLLDIPTITTHARSLGIIVGWDLAHAAGNVPLHLHDWGVDFAVWCSYKYLNCGPGSIGGLFVHARHADATAAALPRLAGWWGSSKASRFAMTNAFEPVRGAAGWQLSNPSVADLTAVKASLAVFGKTSVERLRQKSLALTAYLEELLDEAAGRRPGAFEIITPRVRDERGAQLSLRVKEGTLEGIMDVLEEEGVVVDERRPDVIRVAPAPLYNTYADCLLFVRVFEAACQKVQTTGTASGGTMLQDTSHSDTKGWSEIQ